MTNIDLKSFFISCCKKESSNNYKQLLGMEYENFVLISNKAKKRSPAKPMDINGDTGVFSLLEKLVELTKDSDDPLEKIFEKNMLLSLKRSSGSKITVEPGGQIELSDAPKSSLSEVHKSLISHLKLLKNAVSNFEGKLLFLGVQPFNSLETLPFFPKKRYQIMFPHMLETGTLGQWMMKASSGIQVSIDYASIEDLQRKFVFLNRLSPFLSAIFANSPIVKGAYSEFLSYRSHIWRNTDKSRAGLPKIFLKDSFIIEDYINWALNASPYHLIRDGEEVKTSDWKFKELLEGDHPDLNITINDWKEHLGMLFPDIRIKDILEVRVIDSFSPKYSIAVPALVKALLYNESVFDTVFTKLMDLPLEEYNTYKKAAAKQALHADVNRTNFKKIAIFIVEKAIEGLGGDDEKWLIPFFENFTKEGLSPADKSLNIFMNCGEDANAWFENHLNADIY